MLTSHERVSLCLYISKLEWIYSCHAFIINRNVMITNSKRGDMVFDLKKMCIHCSVDYEQAYYYIQDLKKMHSGKNWATQMTF